ncbi:hypothetical protein ACXYMU_10740 [Pontibacter sp. CAU 1760]
MEQIKHTLTVFACLSMLWLASCQTTTPTGTDENGATITYKSLAPQNVDIRGSIVSRRYNEGQVVLEVEGIGYTPGSRYNRAYVLVQPVTQITDTEGKSISLSELQMGQNVAIMLRGHGSGNFVGVGVARRVWLEEIF